MAIGTKTLVNCVNTNISSVSDPLEILQLSSVARDFDQSFVKSVATCGALPAAADNKGRMIYVEDRCSYRWSDGTSWSNDFTSTVDDFAVYGWGENFVGNLGDGSTQQRSSPVSVAGGGNDWCQLSAGYHTLAIKTNGTLWAWGANGQGRLGDNSVSNKSSPVSVVGGFTDWCQASAGLYHSVAIRTNGTLWAWGRNYQGRLGDNTTVNKSSPVSVVGGFTDWCQASAGGHSLAVRTNGTLWAWGCNSFGRLGDNTTVNKSSPVSVVGGFTDWCQASAGNDHSLGVRRNGTLWAWGYNASGTLGDNTVVSKSSPVSVVGGFTDWCQASAGEDHSLGVRMNGTLWAWGSNRYGRIGDGTTFNRSSPVSVVGGFTDWCQASAGSDHSLAVRTNGAAWAWGKGSGYLGNNSSASSSSPVSVVGGFIWRSVSAGNYHSVALRATKGF